MEVHILDIYFYNIDPTRMLNLLANVVIKAAGVIYFRQTPKQPSTSDDF